MAQESSLISVNDFVELRRSLSAARDGGQPWFVLGETFAQALAAVADADLAGLRKAASEASSKCRPAVGAATAPDSRANTVW